MTLLEYRLGTKNIYIEVASGTASRFSLLVTCYVALWALVRYPLPTLVVPLRAIRRL